MKNPWIAALSVFGASALLVAGGCAGKNKKSVAPETDDPSMSTHAIVTDDMALGVMADDTDTTDQDTADESDENTTDYDYNYDYGDDESTYEPDSDDSDTQAEPDSDEYFIEDDYVVPDDETDDSDEE